MWFKLAGATFTNNLGTMDSISKSYMMDYSGLTGLSASPGSVSYASDSTPDATITFTVKSGYVFKSGSKVTASGGASKTYTASADLEAGSTFTMALTGITGKVMFTGAAELVSIVNPEPETPTQYRLTIIPNPADATVTMNGVTRSVITVNANTSVSWSVSKSGYTTQTGTWTATENKTLRITLVAGGITGDGDPGGGTASNFTLIHGNKYSAGFEDNTARASISPLTITVPNGVTITNKPTIKWAYYSNVNTNNMPSGTGSGTWDDYKYTGTGKAIGISFKKVDDSVFDWSVDSTNPADYFDVSDAGLWNGTAQGNGGSSQPETPPADTPTGTPGDITALTLVDGNPYGTAEQQAAKNRVHSSTALYVPAGTVISCKDTSTYKWALRRVKSETNLSDAGDAAYKPDSAWTTKTSYTTEKNGYWCFILLKASNADFDWGTDSNKVSDYFTVS